MIFDEPQSKDGKIIKPAFKFVGPGYTETQDGVISGSKPLPEWITREEFDQWKKQQGGPNMDSFQPLPGVNVHQPNVQNEADINKFLTAESVINKDPVVYTFNYPTIFGSVDNCPILLTAHFPMQLRTFSYTFVWRNGTTADTIYMQKLAPGQDPGGAGAWFYINDNLSTASANVVNTFTQEDLRRRCIAQGNDPFATKGYSNWTLLPGDRLSVYNPNADYKIHGLNLNFTFLPLNKGGY